MNIILMGQIRFESRPLANYKGIQYGVEGDAVGSDTSLKQH